MSIAVECKKLVDRGIGVPLVNLRRLVRKPTVPDLAQIPTSPRILLIKFWGVGNLAMILPLVRGIRQRWPDAMIHFLTLSGNREFIESSDSIDEGIYFLHGGWVRPFARLLELARELRRRRYDVVLDFEQFMRASALLASGSRAPVTVGFRTPHQWRHALYHIDVPHDDSRHMALVFADVVRAVGVETEGLPPLFAPRSSHPSRRITKLVASLRSDGAPIVALHVGSGDNFEGRRWPIEHFARLANLLIARVGAHIVFTGTDREQRLVRACAARVEGATTDLCGQLDLRELVELLQRVDLLVSNDTAPVHLGSAVGTPLIALYGPNSPRLYGPLSPNARSFYRGLGCSPCITNSNAKTSFCQRPLCLSSIDPSAVAATAFGLLGSSRRAIAVAPPR